MADMSKILESLSKIFPEDQFKDMSGKVKDFLSEATKEMEAEFDGKLQEAYLEYIEELKEAEETAYAGYREALSVMKDMKVRMEKMRDEYDSQQTEGYEEAAQMLEQANARNEELATELYEEYDKKFAMFHDKFVDALHEFLVEKGDEIYTQARKDIVNDPRMAEHKVVLDKIIENVSDYVSDEHFHLSNNKRLQSTERSLLDANNKVKLLEAKNVRLSIENGRLNENVRENRERIVENVAVSRNRREEKAKKAMGRGHKTLDSKEIKVIAEHYENTKESKNDTDAVVNDEPVFTEWHKLAGLDTK